MAAPGGRSVSCISLRGSRGVWMVNGPPLYSEKDVFPGSEGGARAMVFSQDGTLFAYCDGRSVTVVTVPDHRVVCQVAKPRTAALQISPLNNILATWEPYAVTKDQAAGTPNMNLWDLKTGSLIRGFIQKKSYGWCPQWSADEGLCARAVNNEIQFFEDGKYDEFSAKLHQQKVADFSIPQKVGKPCNVAIYVPGSKGQPSFVRLYRYPNFGGATIALASKSFYKADKVELIWNNKGTAVLVLTATDTSADSYYGEQGLHYIATNGESCLVPRAKDGPVYSVEWNPDSNTFCVVYGFMPAKATLYNLKAEAVFDFGTGPRNACYFNPQGNLLVLAGFGNLRGNVEVWDTKNKRLVSNPRCEDSTYFEWCADGTHILTATCAPRLRVGNGFKIWHYTGTLLHDVSVAPGEELWQASWQPALDGVFAAPRITTTPVASGNVPQQQADKPAYVPPALRGVPQPALKPRYREEYEPASNIKEERANQEPLSKSALKNKKKREAKQKAKVEGASATPPPAAPSSYAAPPAAAAPSSGDPEVDKKVRAVRKKLQAIEKLKEKQAKGETLELNQQEKLKTEEALLKELQVLTL